MSLPWRQRKTRLAALVHSHGDDDADGTTVDRLMHGQNAIGKTSKTAEIDSLRFQDKDLQVVGTLEYGQFGVIQVVTCKLDNKVYVRKSIEKKFALRTREQCSPQTERNILLAATLSDSPWAPQLLAAYQMPTQLHLVMDYAEGGNLWDVLESSPGKLSESDLKWWAPQAISAIHWCHSQGYAHRDVKPHNFVLTREARVQLIDFGSAAPLLPPGPDGSQKLPRKHCLVPCGTCDYISPEILQAHEEALVALEIEEEDQHVPEPEGYGAETDWWSFGAMLYELAYGIAPFFANEIRYTYQRILNHEKSLRFDHGVSPELRHFLASLLTQPEQRLGRHNIMEITDHPFFAGVPWATLEHELAPEGLHLPQFTYNETPVVENANEPSVEDKSESYSQGFAFSALFQSSQASMSHPNITSVVTPKTLRNSISEDPSAAFIGFTWGPTLDAFPETAPASQLAPVAPTPSPFRMQTPLQSRLATPLRFTPHHHQHQYMTPVRPYALSHSPMNTLRRTSTLRPATGKRDVSDREAMKQLVDCIGMSARKKVLESGRKPKILTTYNLSSGKRRSGQFDPLNGSLRRRPSIKSFSAGLPTGGLTTDLGPALSTTLAGTAGAATGSQGNTGTGTTRKELRFFPTVTPIPMQGYPSKDEFTDEEEMEFARPPTRTNRLPPLFVGRSASAGSNKKASYGSLLDNSDTYPMTINSGTSGTGGSGYIQYPFYGSSECSSGSEGPPSPSPSPRPSLMSLSRRSGTPTVTTMSALSASNLTGRLRSTSGSNMLSMTTFGSATGLLGVANLEDTPSGRKERRNGLAQGFRRVSAPPVVQSSSATVAESIADAFQRTPKRVERVVEESPDRSELPEASLSFQHHHQHQQRHDASDELDYRAGYEDDSIESDDDDYSPSFGHEYDHDDERWPREPAMAMASTPKLAVGTRGRRRDDTPYCAVSRVAATLWDELESRHEKMMLDIKLLEQRLDSVSRSL